MKYLGYLGECRYGHFGCDYVLVTRISSNVDDNSLQSLVDALSGFDDDAMIACEELHELMELGFIRIKKLYEHTL